MARVAAGALAALFVVAAALQLNDPDPLGWTAIYAAAALAAALAASGRGVWPLAATVGLVAAVWAAAMAPAAAKLGDLARAMGPDTGAEEARELVGLLLVAAAMAALVVHRDRFRTPRRR
jgi:hypothetical protein